MPVDELKAHKVRINTWGTNDQTSNGLDNFIKQGLFGGSVGHASIEMTLPVNENAKKWIEMYCMEINYEQFKATLNKPRQQVLTFEQYLEEAPKRIPVRLIEKPIEIARYNEEGQLIAAKKNEADLVSYYKIDFSFWRRDNHRFYLSTIEEDMVYERAGRHFEYSDRARDYFEPEERIHRGRLGSQRMSYAPAAITHQRNMSDLNFQKVILASKLEKVVASLEAKEILLKKIQSIKTIKIDGSLNLICKNVGLDVESLKTEFLKTRQQDNRTTGQQDNKLT